MTGCLAYDVEDLDRSGSVADVTLLLFFLGGARLAPKVCRVLPGLAFGPGLRRQARRAGRGSRVNSAPEARRAQRDAKHC